MILELILAIEDDKQRSVVTEIFLELYEPMYQLTWDILKHDQDAEDSVMETFVRIIRNADKFMLDDHNEVLALAIIYTRNVAKTFYKKRKKRYADSLTVYPDEDSLESVQMDIVDPDEDIERIFLNKETKEILNAALDQLVPEQRDAVLLKCYYGYRYVEIAKLFGISENAARARVFRGKVRLKELLGADIYERIEF